MVVIVPSPTLIILLSTEFLTSNAGVAEELKYKIPLLILFSSIVHPPILPIDALTVPSKYPESAYIEPDRLTFDAVILPSLSKKK